MKKFVQRTQCGECSKVIRYRTFSPYFCVLGGTMLFIRRLLDHLPVVGDVPPRTGGTPADLLGPRMVRSLHKMKAPRTLVTASE